MRKVRSRLSTLGLRRYLEWTRGASITEHHLLEREVIHFEYLHISEEASKNFPGIGELEEEQFYDDCGNRVPEERISFM